MREVVAAVDVGGTRAKAALVDRSYGVVAALTVPTPADVAADVGGAVASAVAELLRCAGPDARPDAAPDAGPDARQYSGPVRVVGCGGGIPGAVGERRPGGPGAATPGRRRPPPGG